MPSPGPSARRRTPTSSRFSSTASSGERGTSSGPAAEARPRRSTLLHCAMTYITKPQPLMLQRLRMPRREHLIAKAVGVAVDRDDKLWTSARSAPAPEINYLSAAEVLNSAAGSSRIAPLRQSGEIEIH